MLSFSFASGNGPASSGSTGHTSATRTFIASSMYDCDFVLHLDISLRPSSGHFGFTDVAELTLDFGNVFNFNFENNRGIMNYFIDPVTLNCFEEGFTSMHDGAQTSPKVTI